MRKFYSFMLAVLISGTMFAQRTNLTAPTGNEQTRNGWIGNTDWTDDAAQFNIYDWPAGHEIAFSPLFYQMYFQNALCSPGDRIEKVRFAFTPDEDHPNRQFTLKIYNNIDASGSQAYEGYGNYVTLPANACGNPVYTQTLNCTNEVGWQTFTLNTPFTITASANNPQIPAEFWISLTPAADTYIVGGDWNGYSGDEVFIEGQPVELLGVFFEYDAATQPGDEDLWLEYVGCTTSCNDADLHIQPLAIGCYFNDGGALNLDCYPLAVWTTEAGELHNQDYMPANGTLPAHISMINLGPDVIPAGQTMDIRIFIDGTYTGFHDAFQIPGDLTLDNQLVNCTNVTFDASDFNYEPGIHYVELKVLYAGKTYTNTEGTIFYVYYDYDGVITPLSEISSIYPNPASSQVTVSNVKGAKLTVVNSLGQIVTTIAEADNDQTIDASGLANGVYVVRIEKGGDVNMLKFTVNK